jgi:predicted NBD/HSP70 family sugar kinase
MSASPAARPDAIRRHNLTLVLGEIHRNGALTRAQLTKRLGVSRSTIGALVTDLIDLGLVQEEVPTGGERAGRPSHVVEPRRDGPYVVAVDVDVTHLSAAAVSIGGTVTGRHVIAWPDGAPAPAAAARAIRSSVRALQRRIKRADGPVGIGISVPGTVERRSGLIGVAPNLGWRAVPFRDLVGQQVGLPVGVGNDADLAVLAEHTRGSAAGCEDVVYLIGRVGVGAGIVANGVPLRGAAGHAGEIGHNVIDLTGPQCHCGNRGCLETFIGDVALLTNAGREQPPTDENVRALFAAARAGEVRALDSVRFAASKLGQAIAELVNTIDPQRVMLGGSLVALLDIAENDIRQALERYVFTGTTVVELVRPAYGADSSLLGAAEIAFESLLADPLSVRQVC